MRWPCRLPIRRWYLPSTMGQYRVTQTKFSTFSPPNALGRHFSWSEKWLVRIPQQRAGFSQKVIPSAPIAKITPCALANCRAPLVEWEIDKGILDVGAALGDHRQVAPFFRVPGLARSDVIESELAARVLVDFGSDTVADDWHHRISPKKIIALAMNRLEAHGKGILLLHDIHPATVAALPGLLKELNQRGFHIVHVVPTSVDQF